MKRKILSNDVMKKLNLTNIKDAWLSKPLKDGVVECMACNHRCKIPKGKTGICGVRHNHDGTLKLLVYGQVAAQNIDPIEKKPLYHFYPGTSIYSIGTVGCNFRCSFCQNWEIATYHKNHGIDEILGISIPLKSSDIVNYCLQKKIPSIAFTYNEPGIFFEFAYDTAKLAKEKGLKTVYVSNGFETEEAFEKISPYLDAINIDLKSFQDEYYKKICGGHVEPVKENIKRLWNQGMWVEVTTLITTNHNDTEEEFRDIAKFLADISPDIPWHISRYFPCHKMSDPPTPMDTLEKAYEIGKKAGLNYVYMGNVMSFGKENTYCPKCNELLVERLGYSVESYMQGDQCPNCRKKIVGRF